MPWYEKEDLEKAREMTAIEYLKRYEPQRLKPCRGLRHEYELTDHDSFKINEITSQWHWKSRDIGGISALNFLVHVNGMSFLDAVGFLLEQNPYYFKYIISGTKNSFVYIIKPKIESTEGYYYSFVEQ